MASMKAIETHQPMRVLEACSADVLGGGEVHVVQLVEELRRCGHHVEVAGRTGGPALFDHELPFANSLDVASALRFRRIVRAGHFYIIHAHVARDYVCSCGCADRPVRSQTRPDAPTVIPRRMEPSVHTGQRLDCDYLTNCTDAYTPETREAHDHSQLDG
jgi:hypothetical protein